MPEQATTGLKGWLSNFPTQPATTATALLGIVAFIGVVTVRLARGLNFPDGYESYMIFLAAVAGVSTAGMIGKRLSDYNYKAAGTSPVNVNNADTVNANPAPVPAAPGALPAGAVTLPLITPAAAGARVEIQQRTTMAAADAPGAVVDGEGD